MADAQKGADSGPWTIRRVIAWTREEFERRKLDSPRLDAELLLGHALGLSRMQLYLDMDRPLSSSELAGFKALMKRRAAREPVSQILGTREFWSRPFKVTRDTLTPRPETEQIVEEVLAYLKAHPSPPPVRVLDVGTGTGCLAITLQKEIADSEVVAVDISPAALEVARQNAEALGANVRLVLSDLDGALDAAERFHVVVSNPPYLTGAEFNEAEPEVREFEPRNALVGEGDDGLGHHRRLASQVWPRVLGGIWVELGWKQGPDAVRLWQAAVGEQGEVTLLKDLSGKDRVIRVLRR